MDRGGLLFIRHLTYQNTVVEGKEREYLSWFFNGLAYNSDAITDEEIDRYVSVIIHLQGECVLGLNIIELSHRTQKTTRNQSAMGKITMPVLVLSGDIYPALGGDFPGSTDIKLYTGFS